MTTIFEEIISPLKQILNSKGKEIDVKSDSRRLYFQDFISKLVYANLIGINSLRSFITDLETSQKQVKLLNN